MHQLLFAAVTAVFIASSLMSATRCAVRIADARTARQIAENARFQARKRAIVNRW